MWKSAMRKALIYYINRLKSGGLYIYQEAEYKKLHIFPTQCNYGVCAALVQPTAIISIYKIHALFFLKNTRFFVR